ncbi:MAG: two-component system sensor histidine kinase NtrB [Acidimicrobiia bacterium]
MAIAIVAALSVVIYLGSLGDAADQHSQQQLANLRTAAVGVQGEVQSLAARLRQFSSLPSVQSVDLPYVSQRIGAAFGDNPNAIMRYLVRIDANRRLYSWTPDGQLQDDGVPAQVSESDWQQIALAAKGGPVRMSKLWWQRDPPPNFRAVIGPVYRTSPSAQLLVPPNDFNGLLAIVFDLNAVAETYLGPTVRSLGPERIMAGIATPDFGLRIGADAASVVSTKADPHGHLEREGTSILDDATGRRLHAWAKLDAAGESWLLNSSVRYDQLTYEVTSSARAQLALTTLLLLGLPLAAWLVLRRERSLQAEQRLLERRLAESRKMEAIGKLAGGVAHDFNNMLTAILGYASMIQEDAPPQSPAREQAQHIRHAAETAASLTQKLLAFSRKQMLQSDSLDFRAMLGNLLPLVRGAVGKDITVTPTTSDNLWPIMADPVQLEQSILNLALNARDAMPRGGTLRIAARNAPRPAGELRSDTDVKPGDYVEIVVADTGVGMDEATRTQMLNRSLRPRPRARAPALACPRCMASFANAAVSSA